MMCKSVLTASNVLRFVNRDSSSTLIAGGSTEDKSFINWSTLGQCRGITEEENNEEEEVQGHGNICGVDGCIGPRLHHFKRIVLS